MPLFDGAVITTNLGMGTAAGTAAGTESADAGVSMATDAVDDVGEATAAAILTKLPGRQCFVDNYNECDLFVDVFFSTSR